MVAIMVSLGHAEFAIQTEMRLEAENTVLRCQALGRVNFDRLFLFQLYRWFPSIVRVVLPMFRQ